MFKINGHNHRKCWRSAATGQITHWMNSETYIHMISLNALKELLWSGGKLLICDNFGFTLLGWRNRSAFLYLWGWVVCDRPGVQSLLHQNIRWHFWTEMFCLFTGKWRTFEWSHVGCIVNPAITSSTVVKLGIKYSSLRITGQHSTRKSLCNNKIYLKSTVLKIFVALVCTLLKKLRNQVQMNCPF